MQTVITKRNNGSTRTPKSKRWNTGHPSDTPGKPKAAVVAHNCDVFTRKGMFRGVSITAGGRARILGIAVEPMKGRQQYKEKGVITDVLLSAFETYGARHKLEKIS